MMHENEIKTLLKRYSFYHVIPLTHDIKTPGITRFVPIQKNALEILKGIDLRGKRVLDIGCKDGLFSLEAEKMGASEVVGIDTKLSKAAVEFLIPYFNSKIKMHAMSVYDLSPEKVSLFDVVIFFGVLYHLRYPFWAIKKIRSVLKPQGTLLLETAILKNHNKHAVLYCPVGKDSPYESTSCTFFNEKALVDNLRAFGFRLNASKYMPRQTLSFRWKEILKQTLKTLTINNLKNRKPLLDRGAFIFELDKNLINDHLEQYWNSSAQSFHQSAL